MSNLSNKHLYRKIRMNNSRKTGHTCSLTTESNIHNYQSPKTKTHTFLPKIVLFETGDHCNVKFKQ